VDDHKGKWMDRSTAVSIRANRTYLAALKELARRRKKTVALLVRETLDKELGDELSPLSSFFEDTVNIDGRSS
jgi:predicted DNA-binding ribbon-helix-helix protein